jgi:hypothetical protein
MTTKSCESSGNFNTQRMDMEWRVHEGWELRRALATLPHN